MPHFNHTLRKISFKHFSVLFVLGVFIASSLASVLTNVIPAYAANTYSYASNNAQIVLKKPSGKTYNIPKVLGQERGMDRYQGSVTIAGPNNTDCSIGLLILVSPGAASGTISAPADQNGLPSAGVAGATYIDSCPRDFAAASSEYNKSITIATSSSSTPAPANPETVGQKEGLVTVFSKTKNPPDAKVTRTVVSTSTSDTKPVAWNTSSSTGSARWQDLVVGTSYTFCVYPTGVFDTVGCKTATKEYGKALLVQFGTVDTVYNEDGKKVKVSVHIDIPNAPAPSTYGPVELTLFSNGLPAGTGETQQQTFGDSVTVAQSIVLTGIIDSVEPGTYKVCTTINPKLCSADFTKVVNDQSNVDINIGVDDSSAFLINNKITCGIQGLGWIVCPVMSFMSDLLASAFDGIASNFLQTDIGLYDTGSGTYAAWGIFRTFANIAFVIVFLIIIFSQLTGLGVSNYGVKKLLPRIIIAAILVNLSYFICQIAVDLSNILGYSLKSVFDGIAVAAQVPTSGDASANGFGVAAVVAGVIGTAVIAYFSLAVLIPVLIGALIGVLMIALMLIARKAIIILLIVLSPIAFVAFLLPNTESLFTKWRKAFMALLLLFPIISVVFGISSLASQIVLKAGPGSGSLEILQIMAIGIAALPFFMVPTLLKGSLDGIGSVGAKLNGFASKVGGGLGKAGSKGFGNTAMAQGRENRRQGRATYRNQKFARTVAAGGFRAKLAKGPGFTKAQRYANEALERSAVSTSDKADSEEVSSAETLLRAKQTNPTLLISEAKAAFASAVDAGDTIGARAAQNILLTSGGSGIKALHQVINEKFSSPGSKDSEVGQSVRTALNRAGLKPKNNALASWAYNDKTIGDTSSMPDTFNTLSDNELGGHALINLQAAKASGVLTAARAKRMIENPVVAGAMGEEERTYLNKLVSDEGLASSSAPKPGDTPPAAPTPPPTSPTGGSGPSGLVIPHDDGFNRRN